MCHARHIQKGEIERCFRVRRECSAWNAMGQRSFATGHGLFYSRRAARGKLKAFDKSSAGVCWCIISTWLALLVLSEQFMVLIQSASHTMPSSNTATVRAQPGACVSKRAMPPRKKAFCFFIVRDKLAASRYSIANPRSLSTKLCCRLPFAPLSSNQRSGSP